MDERGTELAKKVLETLRKKSLTLGTVESCTGGLVAALITEIPGASEVFRGGVVVYSNELKEALVHVSPDTLRKYGAVSQQCAVELAEGGHTRLGADVVVAITGIAGPTGGTPQKPVGTTHFAIWYDGRIVHAMRRFGGPRSANRLEAALFALQGIVAVVEGTDSDFVEVVR